MLEGKTVLVTGAAKGIGKAIALAFAKQGCNIVLNYRSNVSDDTIKEIEAYNVKCMPLQGDVSDFATAAEIVKKAFFGPVIPGVPASILQMHNDVILVGDEAALSLI